MALLTLSGFDISGIEFEDTAFTYEGHDFVVSPIRVHMNTGLVTASGFGFSIFVPYRAGEEGVSRQQWMIYSALDTILGNGTTFRYSLDLLTEPSVVVDVGDIVDLGSFSSLVESATQFLGNTGIYQGSVVSFADILLSVASDDELQATQDDLVAHVIAQQDVPHSA